MQLTESASATGTPIQRRTGIEPGLLLAARAVCQLAVRSVLLFLSDPEDLGSFLDELAACRRGGPAACRAGR